MGIIIGTVMIVVLVFVSVCTILCFSGDKASKEVGVANKFIHSYDESSSNIDNSIVKINTLAKDNNGRKTVVIYPLKDHKEGITVSWINKEK